MYSDIYPQGASSTTTLDSCIGLCAQTDNCVAVSWIPTTLACWTKNATNSGTRNGLVWGARLLTTSTSSSPSQTSTAASSPTPATNRTCNSVTNIYGTLVNDNFAAGLAPWTFSGPDANISHAVTYDASAIFPDNTKSYFLLNSTGQNRNSISQLVCGLYNSANYIIYVRYSFVDAVTLDPAVVDERFYDLQILFNGTVVQETTMSPGMVDAENFYTASLYFQATSSEYDLGVSWGVDQGAAGASDNVYAAIEVSNIDFNIQENVGS